VDKAGYLVTAHHVIDGAKRMKIKMASGVLAATDIAILKVEGKDFDTLAIAASSAVKTGDIRSSKLKG
jgi:S1-C subfamily serine protease